MPHVKIGYPHKTKTGEKRAQGDIVYVSPQEARDLVDGGKGKIVKPSPEEIVRLDRERKERESKAAKDKAPSQPAPQEAKVDVVKDEPKAKAPARKPADG